MDHICDGTCGCKRDLDAAATALADASRLLAESVSFESREEWLASAFDLFRDVKVRLYEALHVYRDHRSALGLTD